MSFRRRSWLQLAVLIPVIVAIAPPQASAGVRIGAVVVSGQYTRGPVIYSPFYPPYGFYGWPYYGPFWARPYAVFPGPFVARPGTGKVVLRNASKDAEVYINGAYAGLASDLKSIHLRPGVYNLEVRDKQGSFERRIYVLTGKTLKLDVRSGRP